MSVLLCYKIIVGYNGVISKFNSLPLLCEIFITNSKNVIIKCSNKVCFYLEINYINGGWTLI